MSVSGSFSATGCDLVRPSDESFPFNPFLKHLPYGMTKAFVEHECLKAAAEGLDVVIAVSCAILGRYDFKPSRMGRVLCDVANRRIQFRADMINAFNHTQWQADASANGLDNTCTVSLTTCNPSNDTFGQILGTRAPREIQLGLKFYW